MPVLKLVDNPENFKKVYLPSTEHLEEIDKAWVIVDLGPMLSADIIDVAQGSSLMKMAAVILSRRIKEWNFTNPDGTPVEVSYENVARMELADLRFLNEKIAPSPALTEEQKKTSSSISVTEPQESSTTSSATPSL